MNKNFDQMITLLPRRRVLSILCSIKDKEVEENGWETPHKFKNSVLNRHE